MPASPVDRMLGQVAKHVRDPRVLAAMRAVPRDRFVPPALRGFAYEDTSLSIGHGQTISQPTIVGLMSEALQLEGEERVLEIGTGSGYQAAILAHLAAEVVSVEIVDELRERAARVLRELGLDRVRVLRASEELGAPQEAPFDAILVTAAAPRVPPPLIEQLRLGGRLVIPLGSLEEQTLSVVTRSPQGMEVRRGLPCRFVPLVGPFGFVDTRGMP